MSIDRTDIARLLGELVGAIVRSRLDAVRSRDEDSVVLAFRTPKRERLFLLLSARARFARFHLIGRGSFPARPRTPFAAALEAALAGAELEAARQVAGDRVVEFVFGSRERAGGEAYRVVQEIRESPGNLVLVDPSGAIVASLRPVRRGSEELRPGDRYEFPSRPEETPADPGTVAPPGETDEVPEAFAREPFHGKLAAAYERLEREAELSRRKAEALQGLCRGARRREKALDAARADLAATAGAEDLLERGELLKASLHLLRRGMASVELEDFFRGGGRTVRVELDPELGPRENMERYFRRYRKLLRARPALERRIADLEEDLRRLREAEGRAERARTLEDLEAALESASGLVPAAPEAGPRRKAARETRRRGASGPRRFVSADGQEILVGRNAKGNDELVLRIGHGNDTFVHVSGRPGAHVLVRAVPGRTPSLETLLDAAQLALYFSLPQRSRGQLASGALGEVDYAPLKHVRKPRGAPPGTVLLAARKTLRVRLDPERLGRLLSGRQGAAN